jgi:uncharacterized protein YcgL (UPF0745 family)
MFNLLEIFLEYLAVSKNQDFSSITDPEILNEKLKDLVSKNKDFQDFLLEKVEKESKSFTTKNLRSDLKEILNEKKKVSTRLYIDKHIVGLDHVPEEIKKWAEEWSGEWSEE